MDPLSWNDYVRLALSYAVFTQNDDGSWTVEAPVLSGCVTLGETHSEATMMAEDAVHGWLVTALRFNDEVPLIDGYGLGYLDDGSDSPEQTSQISLSDRRRYSKSGRIEKKVPGTQVVRQSL